MLLAVMVVVVVANRADGLWLGHPCRQGSLRSPPSGCGGTPTCWESEGGGACAPPPVGYRLTAGIVLSRNGYDYITLHYIALHTCWVSKSEGLFCLRRLDKSPIRNEGVLVQTSSTPRSMAVGSTLLDTELQHTRSPKSAGPQSFDTAAIADSRLGKRPRKLRKPELRGHVASSLPVPLPLPPPCRRKPDSPTRVTAHDAAVPVPIPWATPNEVLAKVSH